MCMQYTEIVTLFKQVSQGQFIYLFKYMKWQALNNLSVNNAPLQKYVQDY